MPGTSDFQEILNALQPETPWTHHFDIGGVETISPKDEKFFKKAKGLKELGEIGIRLAHGFSKNNTVSGKRVLDVACGEGGHAIAFAQAGAREVVGVEGRELYQKRAMAVAGALGADNLDVFTGDVRKMNPAEIGTFDITLCFGILHHLGIEDFLPFLQSLSDLTDDTLLLYTHVGGDEIAKRFPIQGPVKAHGQHVGWLFREHADGATDRQKLDQVRASLDNTFSFWAENETLVRALKQVGFSLIVKVYEPHMFAGFDNKDFRQIMVAKKNV